MPNFEIYEGKNSQNRKKTFLVFDFFKVGYMEARKAARRHFRTTDEHIQIECGYTHKGQLYLNNPAEKPKQAKVVRVVYWI